MQLSQVTVLYYDYDQPLFIRQATIKANKEDKGIRVHLPGEFEQGKVIIAVIQGDAKILSHTGERVQH